MLFPHFNHCVMILDEENMPMKCIDLNSMPTVATGLLVSIYPCYSYSYSLSFRLWEQIWIKIKLLYLQL